MTDHVARNSILPFFFGISVFLTACSGTTDMPAPATGAAQPGTPASASDQSPAGTGNSASTDGDRGIRPASGYPACPDHTQKPVLWSLLNVEKHTGISLTESLAMWPASSVSGWYYAHPESRYFGVGKISRDQIENYAKRRNISQTVAEKWLASNLAYEPEPQETVTLS